MRTLYTVWNDSFTASPSYAWQCRMCTERQRGFDWRRNAVSVVRKHLAEKHAVVWILNARGRFVPAYAVPAGATLVGPYGGSFGFAYVDQSKV